MLCRKSCKNCRKVGILQEYELQNASQELIISVQQSVYSADITIWKRITVSTAIASSANYINNYRLPWKTKPLLTKWNNSSYSTNLSDTENSTELRFFYDFAATIKQLSVNRTLRWTNQPSQKNPEMTHLSLFPDWILAVHYM